MICMVMDCILLYNVWEQLFVCKISVFKLLLSDVWVQQVIDVVDVFCCLCGSVVCFIWMFLVVYVEVMLDDVLLVMGF